MLHIILVILKIAGILVAVLLLLLLLAILILLFIPLVYELEGEGKELWGKVKISWLLHAVAITVNYEKGQLSAKLRVLFLKKDLITKPSVSKEPETEAVSETKKEVQREVLEKSDWHPAKIPDLEEKPKEGEIPKESMEIPEEEPREETKKEGVLEKVSQIPQKIKAFKEKNRNLWKRIAGLKKTGEFWWELFWARPTQKIISRIKAHLWYLWKHYRPRKISGRVHFGLEDPALTGQLTGILYLLLPAGCGKVSLEPDFEQTLFEGNLKMKGHIRLCHIMNIGWKLYRDKPFRRLIRGLKHSKG